MSPSAHLWKESAYLHYRLYDIATSSKAYNNGSTMDRDINPCQAKHDFDEKTGTGVSLLILS